MYIYMYIYVYTCHIQSACEMVCRRLDRKNDVAKRDRGQVKSDTRVSTLSPPLSNFVTALCLHIQIYVCMYVHTRTHTHTHMHISIHVYTHTHTHAHTHIHIHIHTQTHSCIGGLRGRKTRPSRLSPSHTYTHVHTRAHTRTRMHTHCIQIPFEMIK